MKNRMLRTVVRMAETTEKMADTLKGVQSELRRLTRILADEEEKKGVDDFERRNQEMS